MGQPNSKLRYRDADGNELIQPKKPTPASIKARISASASGSAPGSAPGSGSINQHCELNDKKCFENRALQRCLVSEDVVDNKKVCIITNDGHGGKMFYPKGLDQQLWKQSTSFYEKFLKLPIVKKKIDEAIEIDKNDTSIGEGIKLKQSDFANEGHNNQKEFVFFSIKNVKYFKTIVKNWKTLDIEIDNSKITSDEPLIEIVDKLIKHVKKEKIYAYATSLNIIESELFLKEYIKVLELYHPFYDKYQMTGADFKYLYTRASLNRQYKKPPTNPLEKFMEEITNKHKVSSSGNSKEGSDININGGSDSYGGSDINVNEGSDSDSYGGSDSGGGKKKENSKGQEGWSYFLPGSKRSIDYLNDYRDNRRRLPVEGELLYIDKDNLFKLSTKVKDSAEYKEIYNLLVKKLVDYSFGFIEIEMPKYHIEQKGDDSFIERYITNNFMKNPGSPSDDKGTENKDESIKNEEVTKESNEVDSKNKDESIKNEEVTKESNDKNKEDNTPQSGGGSTKQVKKKKKFTRKKSRGINIRINVGNKNVISDSDSSSSSSDSDSSSDSSSSDSSSNSSSSSNSNSSSDSSSDSTSSSDEEEESIIINKKKRKSKSKA